MQRRKTNDEVILRMLEEGKSQREISEHFNVSPQSISKRVKRLCPPPPPECLESLTPKEARFAAEVASGRHPQQAALISHECSSLESSKALGYELMRKQNVRESIVALMENEGLTRRFLVRKIKGHADNRDPHVSLKAVGLGLKLYDAFPAKRNLNLNANYHQFEDVDLTACRNWNNTDYQRMHKIVGMLKDDPTLTDEDIAARMSLGRYCVHELRQNIARLEREGLEIPAVEEVEITN